MWIVSLLVSEFCFLPSTYFKNLTFRKSLFSKEKGKCNKQFDSHCAAFLPPHRIRS